MSSPTLFSSAYLPPIEYFSLIKAATEFSIEREENYIKQSYRNRCYIAGSGGQVKLTVPVLMGSFHKIQLKEVRIDYSRRWQAVHIGAIESAYRSAPYFIYYYDKIRDEIMSGKEFLIDLNESLLNLLLGMLSLKTCHTCTSSFEHPEGLMHDHRYSVSPKIRSSYCMKHYQKVFQSDAEIKGLSIIDLLFNTGPEAASFL
jgi:hypothetical protein